MLSRSGDCICPKTTRSATKRRRHIHSKRLCIRMFGGTAAAGPAKLLPAAGRPGVLLLRWRLIAVPIGVVAEDVEFHGVGVPPLPGEREGGQAQESGGTGSAMRVPPAA